MSEMNASVAGVCDLLDKLSKTDTAKVERAAREVEMAKIHAIEPPPELITASVPDYIDTGILFQGNREVPVKEVADAVIGDEVVYLYGPSGSGKGTLVSHLVDLFNNPVREHNRKVFARNAAQVKAGKQAEDLEPYKDVPYVLDQLNGSPETRVAELIGDVDLAYDGHGNRVVVERLGKALNAAVEGHVFFFDECDVVPAGVNAVCHPLFDRKIRKLQYWINGCKSYEKHPRFRSILAGNSIGFGENVAEYAHTQIQSRALMTRVSYMVEVRYMVPDSEAKLLKARVPEVPLTIIKKMVAAANNIRALYEGRSIDLIVSHRETESWCREVARGIKRGFSGTCDSDLWSKVVVPAAWPTFVGKTADKGTAEAVQTELAWR
jgi:MoxR-like ATPase